MTHEEIIRLNEYIVLSCKEDGIPVTMETINGDEYYIIHYPKKQDK